MEKVKVKIISGPIAALIRFALNLIEDKLINKIPNADVRTGAKLLLRPLRGMVDALSDTDPENTDQIREVWQTFLNKEFAEFSHVQLDKLVSGIENPKYRNGLSLLVAPAIDLMRVHTDDNPANDEQAKAILDEFIQNPDVHDFVLQDVLKDILLKVIKDEITVAAILAFIAEAIKNGIGGSLNEDRKLAVVVKLEQDIALLEAA